jgi:hypothetical protein
MNTKTWVWAIACALFATASYAAPRANAVHGSNDVFVERHSTQAECDHFGGHLHSVVCVDLDH